TLVYQTEKFVKENDEKIPSDIKDRVNSAIKDANEALKGTDIEAIKSAVEKLSTEAQAIGQAVYSQQQQAGGAGPTDAGPGQGGAPGQDGGAEDVVDAEIVDEGDKK
ncbi:MAG TPA: Hsp70 family protein, partial [Pseudonocardiaceae bacterium]|nr:Hsp70 family protein [Pseudonocardiaceae bacterium]